MIGHAILTKFGLDETLKIALFVKILSFFSPFFKFWIVIAKKTKVFGKTLIDFKKHLNSILDPYGQNNPA